MTGKREMRFLAKTAMSWAESLLGSMPKQSVKSASMPIFAAVSFMRWQKASSLPLTASARTTLAPQPEGSSIPFMSMSTETRSPLFKGMLV